MSLTKQKKHKFRFTLDPNLHSLLSSCFRRMTKVKKSNGVTVVFKEKKSVQRQKFRSLLYSDPNIFSNQDEHDVDDINSNDYSGARNSSASALSFPPAADMSSAPSSGTASPYSSYLSPWNQPSPFAKSPWIQLQPPDNFDHSSISIQLDHTGLIGSLVREEGHVYSLATAPGDLLYTGSDSKNIRVWKNLRDFAGFKSNSGLVKAIVVAKDKIFTGHQDGKIRVWKLSRASRSSKKSGYMRRVGSLPTTTDYFKTSINPKNYVEVRRHRNVPWIRHYDAVSCMAADFNDGGNLLYSGSWDKTLKVWRLSDSKCIESINAHDDAVNSVAVGFDGLIFTGSADGTVKAWRRELVGRSTQHVLVETLLKQEYAVTSLVVNRKAGAVYAGSSDGLVNFWERDEKHFISHGGILRGHKLAVLCLAAAGNLVFSGSADKSICVWRREGKEEAAAGGVHMCMSVLSGHDGPVKCLAVEEEVEEGEDDGDHHRRGQSDHEQRWRLYSGSLDKSVMVWRVAEKKMDGM